MPEVPFLDLAWQTRQVYSQVLERWNKQLEQPDFVLGEEVRTFERHYEIFSEVSNVVGVANGTDALEICLRVLGVVPGDEVILPANSFIASALAVTRVGAVPVLVDCEPEGSLIDSNKIENAISPKTKAIMPVHLYGQMADMAEISKIADRNQLWVVEDCAQAQGARQGEFAAGAWGDIAATSFYPGKNLGAFGDAGAVITNSAALAKSARAMRNYGSEVKYHHPEFGFNSRLDSMQASVLDVKLSKLSTWNEKRQHIASRYSEELRGIQGLQLPRVLFDNEHVWHLYVVHTKDRNELQGYLARNGIQSGIHYPKPIHEHGAYQGLGYKLGDFPVSELLSQQCLSLPIFPSMTRLQQDAVISLIQNFFSK